MPWQLLSILPNLDMGFKAEARQCAIVPIEDERVVALRAEYPNLDSFLDRFRTAHGTVVTPAVMLLDAAAPDSRRHEEAMVALRNCLSVATVLRQTALALLHPRGNRILFSDPFEFHAWTLDRHFDRMISITPGIMALHRVEDFAGQPAPGSPIHRVHQMDVDRSLFEQLAAHWDHAFGRRRLPPIDRALFRSLNMANAALAMPAVRGVTYLDYGRQCALWISAFEILAHFDAGRDRADLPAVLELLTKKPCWRPDLNARRYTIKVRGRRQRVGLPGKLYATLYKVRNDFLHGNAVSVGTLRLPGSRRFIGHFAPLLYRCALRNYLDLHFVPEAAPADLQARIEARFAARRYEEAQFDTEEALALARVAPIDDEDD